MDSSSQDTSTSSTTQELPNSHAVHEKPGSFLKIALLSALIASSMAVYLFWQNQMLRLKLMTAQISPTPLASPSASVDSTASWQDYFIENLTFQYPEDWSINISNARVVSIKPKSIPSNEEYPAILFEVLDNSNNYSIKMYEDEAAKDGQRPTLYTYGEKTASTRTINGIEGYFLEDIGCEPLGCDTFSFTRDQIIYKVTLIHDSVNVDMKQDKPMLKNAYNKILSTFQFTEPVE